MNAQEKEFEKHLEEFRRDAESAAQFLYALNAINIILSKSKPALDKVNVAPLLWRTILGSLQKSAFIALGRIFDQKSPYNLDRLIRVAQDNIEIFSKKSLALRKRAGSENADEWIDEYLKNVCVPTADDFRRLRKNVKKYRKIYEKNYRSIRDMVYAHKELSSEEMHALFESTGVREMEQLIVFPMRIHKALWELYHNGKKPILKPMRNSIKEIMKRDKPKWEEGNVHERIARDVKKFFDDIASS